MNRTTVLACLFLALAAVPGFAQYCASTSGLTNCANVEEYISNVTIDTLNNNSACLNAPAYEDYTALPGPTLTQLNGTPISVTISEWYSSTDAVTVFCDWNGNFILNDPGEVYPLSQGAGVSGGNTLYTGTITPPAGAVASTRMRVKTRYGAITTPCTQGSDWSNTEDYTVNTLPPTGLVAVGGATPNPVTAGSPLVLTVAVTATSPPNPPTGVGVIIDLSTVGGSAGQLMFDDGFTGGDVTGGDNVFTWTHAPSSNGNFSLGFFAIDSVARTSSGTVPIAVYPSNDTCGTATPLGLGSNGPFTNIYATDSGVIGSCGTGYKDVWFSFVPPCSGPYRIDTCGPSLFDTSLTIHDACGGLELACDEDSGCGYSSSIDLPLSAGTPIFVRVASWSTTAVGTFPVNVNQVFTAQWSSPTPNTIRFDLTGGPLSGTYYHAITLAPGAFPNGWLYGVDITLPELVSQINFGFPFVGPLDPCGNAFFGPIGPVPSFLTIWSVALATNGPVLGLPTHVSNATTYTVP